MAVLIASGLAEFMRKTILSTWRCRAEPGNEVTSWMPSQSSYTFGSSLPYAFFAAVSHAKSAVPLVWMKKTGFERLRLASALSNASAEATWSQSAVSVSSRQLCDDLRRILRTKITVDDICLSSFLFEQICRLKGSVHEPHLRIGSSNLGSLAGIANYAGILPARMCQEKCMKKIASNVASGASASDST